MACKIGCCGSNNAGDRSTTSPPAVSDAAIAPRVSTARTSSPSSFTDKAGRNEEAGKEEGNVLPSSFTRDDCDKLATKRIESVVEDSQSYAERSQSEVNITAIADARCEKSCCTTATPPPVKVTEPDRCCKPSTPLMSTGIANSPTRMLEPSCCSHNRGTGTSEDDEDAKHGCCSPSSTTLKPEAADIAVCCAKEFEPTKSDNGISDSSYQDDCCGIEDLDRKDGYYDQEEPNCNDSCCGESVVDEIKVDCCSKDQGRDNCCISKKRDAIVDTIEVIPMTSDTTDLEKGMIAREHIVLSISGMTCTGCETKLRRVLSTLSYVSNLKTSLVLARAELDILGSAATADDIIKHLQRTTEFKCERVSNQGSSLDLICSNNPTATVNGDWPDGVLEVTQVDKETIRVAFDAKIVGARDLLARDWAKPLRLAPPRQDPTLDAGSRHVRQMGFMTLLSAILTIPVLVLAWAPLPERHIAYGSASLALATIVQVVIAGPFYPKAIKALVFSKVIEMDLLIVLSTSVAYIFSVVSFGYLVAGQPLSTGEFFETSTLLVTLIMVGRWVASLARQKAAESISIRALQAPTAILVGVDKKEREIDARLLQYGDVFKVAPDTRIPTDGTVLSGTSEVDESMLTGESKPVEKHPGSAVIAGSINEMGMLTVRLTRLPGDNTITTIACMVDEAKLSKPKIQDLADKVASYFVPVVITLTIITFAIWVAIGVAVRHQSGSEATIQAITYAITVLIVSCPCAIGLAVPMVIVVASGVAAQRGVIFKSASSIEVAYKTTDVVFDKTGTLTLGKLVVIDESYCGNDPKMTKALLLGLVTGIKHPVSAAAAAHLSSQGTVAITVKDAKAAAGKGVESKFEGKVLRAGNARWLGVSSDPCVHAMLSKGLTAFCFTIDDNLVAVLGLQDTLRPDALATVAQLQKSGLNVHMLSGDDDGPVQAIALQLNISEGSFRSRCSPSDKQTFIKELLVQPSTSSKGTPRKPVVMFIGDGTNDAVALAQATIGVHVASGTDIAQSAADVVLVRSDLSCILTIISISKKAMRRVAFNFGWSFVYNLFAVLLGAGAFVNARIPPEYAGLGELVSVLPVIIAAVLLRWSRI